jgi:hypothetical protein
MGETLVILQRFRPDNLFTKQQELTTLVEAELEASIQRGTRIMKQIQDDS